MKRGPWGSPPDWFFPEEGLNPLLAVLGHSGEGIEVCGIVESVVCGHSMDAREKFLDQSHGRRTAVLHEILSQRHSRLIQICFGYDLIHQAYALSFFC